MLHSRVVRIGQGCPSKTYFLFLPKILRFVFVGVSSLLPSDDFLFLLFLALAYRSQRENIEEHVRHFKLVTFSVFAPLSNSMWETEHEPVHPNRTFLSVTLLAGLELPVSYRSEKQGDRILESNGRFMGRRVSRDGSSFNVL